MALAIVPVLGAAAPPVPRPVCGGLTFEHAAYRLADLPPEIRADLQRIAPDMVDPDASLLDTDAPTLAERGLSTSRLVQAVRVRGDINREWFVQFEIAMMSDVTTIGYVGSDGGPLQRSFSHIFRGPACATIEAARAGVVAARGFDR